MSPDYPWTKRRQKNKIVPLDDLTSERIEVAPRRFIRVLHYSPKNTDSDQGSKVSCSRTNNSFENQDSENIIVIFFIHGVGGCAELWYEQLRHFSKAGYAVVAPDLLGHGGSSSPRDPKHYEFSELANDMMTVFDRFSRKRNILVGHSYGSSFCCLIASMRCRRVSKIVLISGGAPVPLRPQPCSVFCLPIPMLAFIKPLLFWSYERRAFYRTCRSTVGQCRVRAFSAPSYVIKAVLQGQNWEVGDESFHNELMVPALLLHGAQDKFVTLEDEQWMQEAIYSSHLEVIHQSGHMVMLECPEKVNWFIHNFLQRDPTTRSRYILSSREMSMDSIHVKAKVSSTSHRLSLAVESLAEHPMGNNQERSRSVSQLRRSSGVSLIVPGASGVRSNSLPGNSTVNVNEDKGKSEITFKGVEVSNSKETQHEHIAKEQNGQLNTGNDDTNETMKVSSSDNGKISTSNSSASLSKRRKGKRRKGVSKVSTGPLPSVET